MTPKMFGLRGHDFAAPATAPAVADTPPETAAVPAVSTTTQISSFFKTLGQKASVELADSGKKLRIMRQQMQERLGTATKTVDLDLEQQCSKVVVIEHDFATLTKLVKNVALTMGAAAAAQLALCTFFEEVRAAGLTFKAPELQTALVMHRKTFDVMSKNTCGLVDALQYFSSSTAAFARDVDEAWVSLKAYDALRLAYDAARVEYEAVKDTASPKLVAVESQYLAAYSTKTTARDALAAKLAAICERKVDVLGRQLQALSSALQLYVTGNHAGYHDALEQMHRSAPHDAAGPVAEAAVSSADQSASVVSP